MRGDLLVALDELVALVAGEPPAPGELLQTSPLVEVGVHVGVQVHAPTVRSGRRILGAMSDATARPPEFATLTDDDLVTGEAVALDLPPAGLGVRMVSGMIDIAVTLTLLVLVVLLLFVVAAQADAALLWVAWIGTLVTVFLVFPTTVETLSRGKSLGHLSLGLRTVRDDAGPTSFQHAFVRALVGIVEIYAAPRRARVLLGAAQLPRQAARRLRRRHLRRPRAGPPPAPAAHADAARARPVGGRGRHRVAARRPRGRAAPVPRPGPPDRPGLAATPSGCAWPRRPRRTSPRRRRPAPRRSRSSPRSSPRAATVTTPGWCARTSSAGG